MAIPGCLPLLGQILSLRSKSSESRTSLGAFYHDTIQQKGLETGHKMDMHIPVKTIAILVGIRLNRSQ